MQKNDIGKQGKNRGIPSECLIKIDFFRGTYVYMATMT